MLRIVGLIGATIGAAGFARLLGGFLSMIPLVGALVDLSLMVAGALFGLTMGVITIVIGWLAARPWIAAVLLIAIGSAITWAVQHRRKADREQRRSKKLAEMGALARQRAAERAQMPEAPMGAPALAAAGAAGFAAPPPPATPPPAPGSRAPTPGRASATPPPPPPPEEPRELPPLEWTPGLISTKPPSVRAKAEPAPPPKPADDLGAIPFDTTGLRPSAPRPSAAPQVAPPAAPTSPAPRAAPLFDTVEPRQPATPLFDTVEPRQPATPLFDTVEPRQPAPPLFDTVEPRLPSTPLFDTVEPRQPAPMLHTAPAGPADTLDAVALDGLFPAAAPEPKPAPPAPPVRIALGSKGDYTINKIVRRQADGSEQLICFELTRAGKPIARGTQDEVKQKLKSLLSAPAG